ncbi:response regulator [Candidatus Bathyarchaeota archaeon]|nr:response regulator [Candidatus Bathyarchaeota archaeon]
MKVMIVDDNPSMCYVYEAFLEEMGIDVVATTNNGIEAVNEYKENPKKPDIIIMDHRMPLMDGIQAMETILKINANATIIFASADDAIKEKAKDAGASAFLLKPFKLVNLLDIMKKLNPLNEIAPTT